MSPRRFSAVGSSARLTIPVSATRDHLKGPESAKVTLVEYGDYQCPFCGEAYPILERVLKKYGQRLRFVFRNFPLTEMHPRAEFGAEMAEAAGAQGKFWEMHDFLYENQGALGSEDFFLEFGGRLGLDLKRIRQELMAHVHLSRIHEDFMSGIRSGVNGTPTFYINERRHDGDYQFETLVDAIDAALK